MVSSAGTLHAWGELWHGTCMGARLARQLLGRAIESEHVLIHRVMLDT